MRLLGNILWHIPFLGFISAIIVYLIGIILTVTVVAAPIGLGLMEYGKFLFAPFKYEMISKKDLNVEQNKLWKTYSTVVMILYLPIGICLTILTVFQIAAVFFTIIGIPVAIVLAKSLGTYLNPVDKKCVHHAVAEEIARKKVQAEIKKALGPG
ncbi:MAG: YccF domain-containing protein [Bacillota bacterium]|nr:YccF domain-containing protein [Bacillota bacterium]